MMTDCYPLRWLAGLLFSLLVVMMGSAAAVARYGDFGHCGIAAKKPAQVEAKVAIQFGKANQSK